MKAAGALVLAADPGEAAGRAVAEARAALGGVPPSLAVLFASAHFYGSAQALVAAVAEETGQLPLIGCVAEGVAGGAREVESGPASHPFSHAADERELAGFLSHRRDQGLGRAVEMRRGEQHRERGRHVPQRRPGLRDSPARRRTGIRREDQGSCRLHQARLLAGEPDREGVRIPVGAALPEPEGVRRMGCFVLKRL